MGVLAYVVFVETDEADFNFSLARAGSIPLKLEEQVLEILRYGAVEVEIEDEGVFSMKALYDF
ncbi:hypothetical protein [Caballeronia eucalypticola]|uniref:hypothetical protein n=1 Tax=Caballeronia sp. 15715 TaxID=3391030 RepID=UPI0039E2664A